jgi:hypothetical protein
MPDERDEVKGSPLALPPDDLDALADLLSVLVPRDLPNVSTEWEAGWHACCTAIRTVVRQNRQGPWRA